MPTVFKSKPKFLVLVMMAVVSLGIAEQASAQLFGAREFGRPFQSRRNAAAPPADAEAGTLQGDERFLRENRPRNAFVGADRGSQQGFVGSEQAIGSGRVVAATESLQPPQDPSSRINRPLPSQPASQMYYPWLVIDFAVPSPAGKAMPKKDSILQERLTKIAGHNIQVQSESGVTVLSGEVDSASLSQKLVLIASFEPHVREIDNRLRVTTSTPTAPRSGSQ